MLTKSSVTTSHGTSESQDLLRIKVERDKQVQEKRIKDQKHIQVMSKKTFLATTKSEIQRKEQEKAHAEGEIRLIENQMVLVDREIALARQKAQSKVHDTEVLKQHIAELTRRLAEIERENSTFEKDFHTKEAQKTEKMRMIEIKKATSSKLDHEIMTLNQNAKNYEMEIQTLERESR